MSLNDQTYQLIESYLLGELSDEAMKNFEERVANEPDLAKELEMFRLMESYIGENDWPDSELESEHPKVKDYLKAYLADDAKALSGLLEKVGNENIDAAIADDSSQKVRPLWKIFSAAAVVLVLFGCLWFVMKPSGVNQYASNLQHEELLLTQRGEIDKLPAEAEEAFNSGDYKTAIPLLKELDHVNGDFHVDIALGIAYLETDELDMAYEEFNQVYHSDALIRDQALWYLAMVHLKRHEQAKALEKLSLLRKNYPQFKTDEVKKLISKLK
ncbi:MAG: hypothetical protein R2730_15200 [Chitinophagales bacterium]